MLAIKFLGWATIAGLLVVTACTPAPTVITISSNSTPGTEVSSVPTASTPGSNPGASEPGAAAGTRTPPASDEQNKPPSEPSGVWGSYANDAYKFAVSHPSDYQLRSQLADKMAQLQPLPVAALVFLSQEKVASDVAELEPPDLEIRVYDAKGTASLENWLTWAGLLPKEGGVSSKPFQTSHVSGLQLCVSTMIFPGCSNFVLGKDRVYQLITSSQVGEEMVGTFTLIP